MMEALSEKIFLNDFVSTFPGDKTGNLTSRQTPGDFYSLANPTPVAKPKLLAWTESLSKIFKLKFPGSNELPILAGNKITASMQPYAMCYGGHQFGHWAGQLGDGRVINLGGLQGTHGIWDLQLKGAGPTAYSRGADGRAVLRSSAREYLISEGMHQLKIPTSRALSIVTTGEHVLRDMFYNGNARYEPGAIVSRMAPTFLRFGNYELLTARNETNNLKHLVDWTIKTYFPQLSGKDIILKWFEEVVDKTASLIVEWQRVGFVHGVMNTDNMSILGLGIDYGPFSFLDEYDLNFTPNTTDLPGRRYAFGNQASVAYWNLGKLASALTPLFKSTEVLETSLHRYESLFWKKYQSMMTKKLGLDKTGDEEIRLFAYFEKVLSNIKPDMHIFYRLLIELPINEPTKERVLTHFNPCLYKPLGIEEKELFFGLIQNYVNRVKGNNINEKERKILMRKNNPYFVLRNYLLHQAIEKLEAGDPSLFQKLISASQKPYEEKYPEFFKKRPSWANDKPGCSMLSCSS